MTNHQQKIHRWVWLGLLPALIAAVIVALAARPNVRPEGHSGGGPDTAFPSSAAEGTP